MSQPDHSKPAPVTEGRAGRVRRRVRNMADDEALVWETWLEAATAEQKEALRLWGQRIVEVCGHEEKAEPAA